jgi:hypothetical protein
VREHIGREEEERGRRGRERGRKREMITATMVIDVYVCVCGCSMYVVFLCVSFPSVSSIIHFPTYSSSTKGRVKGRGGGEGEREERRREGAGVAQIDYYSYMYHHIEPYLTPSHLPLAMPYMHYIS